MYKEHARQKVALILNILYEEACIVHEQLAMELPVPEEFQPLMILASLPASYTAIVQSLSSLPLESLHTKPGWPSCQTMPSVFAPDPRKV